MLWWATDANPKAFKARPFETIIEVAEADYPKGMHPQAYITRETGLDPADDDKFVEISPRGEVVRVFYDDPGRPLGAREKRFKQHKEDVKPKDTLPPGDYTV